MRSCDSAPGPDARLALDSPGGTRSSWDVEIVSLSVPRYVRSHVLATRAGSRLLVAARYLSATVREDLRSMGRSYADATGNLHLRDDELGIFVSARGEDRDPWRGAGRPLGTLKGIPAARVVRALVDHVGPWGTRQLVEASGTSTGSVYRVLDFLEANGLIERKRRGEILVPDWEPLVRRWSLDYEFIRDNTVRSLVAPRGIDALVAGLIARDGGDYAVTGSVAAATWAAHAPARNIMMYASDPEALASELGLRESDRGINVLVATTRDDVFVRGAEPRGDGLRVAAPAQVVVDLMTGPGRSPSEAEELVAWMKGNEARWRTNG